MYTPASQPHRPTMRPSQPAVGECRGGGACSGSLGASSERSSSTVTPNSRARARSLSTSGAASPSSHLLTAWRDTPTRPASSSWDSPAFLR